MIRTSAPGGELLAERVEAPAVLAQEVPDVASKSPVRRSCTQGRGLPPIGIDRAGEGRVGLREA